jgi:putative inorganic carbon (HCO3(-)) transporter
MRAFLLASLIVAEVLFASLVAMRPEDSLLLLGAAIGLIVAVDTFIKPIFGLYLFVALIFTEASIMLGSASAARLMGILVFSAWIVRSISRRDLQISIPRQGWFAVAFILWGFMSALWALNLDKLFTALLLLIQSMMLYLLIINLVNTVRRFQVTLAIIVIVSLALALLTISNAMRGELVEGRVDLGQVSVGDINAQAAYLLPSTVLLMVLFSHKSRLVPKLLLLLGFSIGVLAILATASRGAMVALVAILALGLLIDRNMWQVVLPVLIAGGGALLVLPHTFVDRFISVVTLSDRGAGRLDIWSVAWQIIRFHPVAGVGLDSFGTAFDRYVSETPIAVIEIGRGLGSHNVFLNLQSELGIIGFVLLAAFIGITVKGGWDAIRNTKQGSDSHLAPLALGVWLSLASILVMALFIDLQYWKLFWLLLALVEVGRRLSVKTVERQTY